MRIRHRAQSCAENCAENLRGELRAENCARRVHRREERRHEAPRHAAVRRAVDAEAEAARRALADAARHAVRELLRLVRLLHARLDAAARHPLLDRRELVALEGVRRVLAAGRAVDEVPEERLRLLGAERRAEAVGPRLQQLAARAQPALQLLEHPEQVGRLRRRHLLEPPLAEHAGEVAHARRRVVDHLLDLRAPRRLVLREQQPLDLAHRDRRAQGLLEEGDVGDAEQAGLAEQVAQDVDRGARRR